MFEMSQQCIRKRNPKFFLFSNSKKPFGRHVPVASDTAFLDPPML